MNSKTKALLLLLGPFFFSVPTPLAANWIIVSEQRLTGHVADKLFESLNGPAIVSYVSGDYRQVKYLQSSNDNGNSVEISCVKEDRACKILETRWQPDKW